MHNHSAQESLQYAGLGRLFENYLMMKLMSRSTRVTHQEGRPLLSRVTWEIAGGETSTDIWVQGINWGRCPSLNGGGYVVLYISVAS
jgi:hypothetical protein